MTKSEITSRLSWCFDGLESAAQQRLRAGHSAKTIRRVICIDYTPVTLWQDNVEYFCVMESQNGVEISVCFKHLFNSDKHLSGMLQRINSNADKVLARLQVLTTVISSCLNRDLDAELTNTIVSNIPTAEMSIMLKALDDREYATYSEYEHIKHLKNLADAMMEFKCSGDIYSVDALNQLLDIVTEVIDCINEIFSGSDTLEDLSYFARNAYGAEGEVVDISNISEVFAVNLITKHYRELSPEEKDKFMFFANNELMHLFFSNFSPLSRFMDSRQNTFRILSEYVPIAMKFAGVENPLFDESANTSILDSLAEKYHYIANSEACINTCAMDGSIVHTSGLYSSEEDEADLEHMSSVRYGLCCDISSIFSSRHPRAVAPHPDGKSIVFSTDLAACVMLSTLVNATLQAVYSTGEKYIFDEEDLKSFKLYANLKEVENSVGELLYCTPFKLLTSNCMDKVVATTYVDAMLLRTAMHMNLRDISDTRVICNDLRDSLEYSSNNLTEIGMIL